MSDAEDIIRLAHERAKRAADEPQEFVLPDPIDWAEVFAASAQRELLAGMLWCPKGRGIALYAGAKDGKTEFVTEQVYQALSEGLVVSYFDREMGIEDLRERVEDLGATKEQLANLRYYLHPALPDLDRPGGGDAVLAIVQRDQSDLVVFDTAARFVAGDESDNRTWQDFFRYTGSLLKGAGVTMVRIDHSGKEKARGQRGASAKADDVDVVWQLSRTDIGNMLKLTHSRVSWLDGELHYLRDTDPVSYHQNPFSLPEGTLEIAALLDRLKVPIDVGVRVAAKVLRDGGYTARQSVVSSAVKHRKRTSELATRHAQSVTVTRTPEALPDQTGNGGKQGRETPGSESVTGRVTPGNTPNSAVTRLPPSIGGNGVTPSGKQSMDKSEEPPPKRRVVRRKSRPS